MPDLLIGLFSGLLLGIIIEKYIFPALDIIFEVFTAKTSEIITEHNLNIQSMSCELLRVYPELKDGNVAEQVNAIGFQCQSDDGVEEEDYEDEE